MLREGVSTPTGHDGFEGGVESDGVVDVSLIPMSDAVKRALAAADDALAEHIRNLLCAGFVAEGLRTDAEVRAIVFDDDLKMLLNRTWSFAALIRSGQVLPSHLIAAISSSGVPVAAKLADIGGVEPQWLLAGSVVQPALLNAVAGPIHIGRIYPSRNLLRWIAEARRLAAVQRSGSASLSTGDLLAVLESGEANIKQMVKRAVGNVTRIGRLRSEFVQARQGIDNTSMTLSFFKSETSRHFTETRQLVKALDRDVRAISDAMGRGPRSDDAIGSRLTDIEHALLAGRAADAERLDALFGRFDADTALLAGRLAEVERRLGDRPASPPAPAPVPVGVDLGPLSGALGTLSGAAARQSSRLGEIERRAAAMEARLPSPPAGSLLAATVVAVMALGAAVGWMLGS